ncbi:hypothetical protein BAUCODRAFT_105339 [Baudoinia panamericana UAMH 10762]|uniref:Vacuolar ATPase assembly protein VMA22 n=1 Tax=Baudoinia panamericana (strain UAMH 10762) TaxID=717646 RepID=M2MNF1_BAUPA|nr:uncharacterized protein BAUCODRAFT_105339 [Baudoinia panamericana UAMH 10762]EMC98211.1 hypothetical protein BAUCODRAFT_105339 [Baudoinia panamericana UAMH 10762]
MGSTGTAEHGVVVATVALHDELDHLWERYLHQVDRYQQAQKELQKQLSSGFLSLAQANKSVSRNRFGQNSYDLRMKATRVCSLMPEDHESGLVQVAVVSRTCNGERKIQTETAVEEPKQQPSPPATPAPEHSEDAVRNDIHGRTTSGESDPDQSLTSHAENYPWKHDPLRWYGVLVPRELRIAQASFAQAIVTPVADVSNAAKHMRALETEIRKLRKAISKAEKNVPR